MLNTYEINTDTLAVLSVDNKTSKIIEKDNEYFIKTSAYKVMDQSCQYFGSSYQGRTIGSRNILNASYKLPVIVEETREIIFFPTSSATSDRCNWIALNNIKNYEKYNDKTKVIFNNGRELILDITYASFDNQLLRANKLGYIFKKRIKDE